MELLTRLPLSLDWKSNGYISILFISDWLIKIVYYKLVQTIITALILVEVILNIVV